MKLRPYFVLLRPANIVTSLADILAGIAIAGISITNQTSEVIALCIAGICLYGGGIVYNDVFDRHIDKKERPERPIPSGEVPVLHAIIIGTLLFLVAIISGFYVNRVSGSLCIAISLIAVFYDRYLKHNRLLGPLAMGAARATNLMLGISISLTSLTYFSWMAVFPLLFIASVTMASRDENAGNNRAALTISLSIDMVILIGLLILSFRFPGMPLFAILASLVWAAIVIGSKWKAWRENTPQNIRRAIRNSVLSIILLDSTYALLFDHIFLAGIIIGLLPLSIVLAKYFAVT